MQTLLTKYCDPGNISRIEYYENENTKECLLSEAAEISTPYGVFVPQYEDDRLRKKYTKSLSFYESGNLKSIAMQKQTPVKTPAGIFPAELITFYESGSIKRLFPLNGKISGFWTEENEYELADEFDFKFKFGNFKIKIIAIQFYENGAIKGLTFWPNDSVLLQTPSGEINTCSGIILYPDGKLKAVEPQKPTVIRTPIGNIVAYDPDPIGVHSDNVSLVFSMNGTVKSLLTPNAQITITDPDGETAIYKPSRRPNLFDIDKMDLVPLKIEFSDGKVSFEDNFYDIGSCHFSIRHLPFTQSFKCGDCSACSGCS